MMANSSIGIGRDGSILDNNSPVIRPAPAADQELVSLLKKNSNKRRVRGGGGANERQESDLTTVVSSAGSRGIGLKCQDETAIAESGPNYTVTAKVKEEDEEEEAAPLKDDDCTRKTNNVDTTITTTNNSKQPQAQKKAQKPRRRVATLAQRRAANIRERRRMFNLNAAFDRLRKKVPSFAYEKRLSRIETLKLAIMYIKFMDDLVNDDEYAEKYKQLTNNPTHQHLLHQHHHLSPSSSASAPAAASSSFLSPGTFLSLYGHCGMVSSNSNNGHDDPPSRPSSPTVQLSLGHSSHHHESKTIIGRPSAIGSPSLSSSYPLKQRQNHASRCNTEPNPSKSTMVNHGSHATAGCRAPASQYCTDIRCTLDCQPQQQKQQQQQQQYRALPASSPISCGGSIACCSSPNSSSTTTCHSFSSAINNDRSSNSTSPTSSSSTPSSQSVSAVSGPTTGLPATSMTSTTTTTLNESPLYYTDQQHQTYDLQAYGPNRQQQQLSTSITRCLYPTGDSCGQQINPMPTIIYYNNHADINMTRKPLESYSHNNNHNQPLDVSPASSTYHYNHHHHTQPDPNASYHHQQNHHSGQLTNDRQHFYNGGNQHTQHPERVEHQQIYSLHSLEAI